ncbi:MAG: exodeoxyribonuclease VII large subunit [Dehalococcoidia bacterium]|nr:exodeoxyribonuclease VII large subunit [Dehalococcoidia bacterium]MDP6228070.1 exodeoxyribonuclease VII large subunit [Dehalococcoidia bacterium]MDP7199606.1 exodeoxyribonuclease VII large subunit [Dehalococcoidia bacterium]MDP7511605.1 exodeoxyribonuclease VII large subunit [Dehalococcoidia bacterium]
MAVYTVSQVTRHLKDSLENDPLLADLWLLGEVSNFRLSSSGHAYFTLKDDQSVLNCVMFRGQPGVELLASGTSVSAHGRITFYTRRGSTDFMVDLAMPEGVGELALELEQLRQRLDAEGLFEITRKRPLPQFPQVVGVVTSPTGAVFHDIQNVIRRRYPLVELVLSPTPVQGAGAAASIASALENLDRDGRTDVIIIARGGGSLEELWPFNEEVVARAIYACRSPVVCGVGHETDTTIADQVADVRAPTPSAAAELVVPHQDVLRRQLAALAEQSLRAMALAFGERRTAVAGLVRRMDGGLPNLETWRRRVDDLARGADVALVNRVGLTRSRVEGLGHRLRALDPAATLKRGFSVVQNASSGQVVSSTAQVATGDALTITVSDGFIPATAGSGARTKAVRKPRATAKGHGMERLL